jgi:hypothetical protein
MKRRVLIRIAITLPLAGILGCCAYYLRPPSGTVERCAELHDGELGDFYVVAAYDGLGSVAFFRRDLQGVWSSFYLDHDALRWRNVGLERHGMQVRVKHEGHVEAEYDCVQGHFLHVRRQHRYTRQEGIDDGKSRVATFRLSP